MFSTLKVSISALFFTSSLVLGHDGECYVAPCGRVENYYASRFDACYGTTVAATNAICAVWNNNGLIEGAGGPDPKPGNEPCVCRDLGPGGTTGMGGIAENLDLDWFAFHDIDYSVEWTRITGSFKTIPKGQYTKINSLETAVCRDVAGKPHCTITLFG